jgi:hypothetical protein
MEQIINEIKKLNITVGEVLEYELKQGNIELFNEIVANFIKLNCQK